jgi:hypothetical protein
MSAENASTLWNLRCEVREKLMDYIVKHHPECLAAKRNLTIYYDRQSTTPPKKALPALAE